MNKLLTILIIAQNGLKTASGLLTANATSLEAQAAKTEDKKEASNLKKKAAKAKKLAKVLAAADVGIASYVSEEI